jgi:HPt (histidine-containing phosphotransfer) domain-containing protein
MVDAGTPAVPGATHRGALARHGRGREADMAAHGHGASGSPMAFDLERLASISGDDAEFERELAGEYLAQTRKLLVQIAQSIESGDAATLRRDAHTLKGSSLTVGAEGLGAMGAELERNAGQADPALLSEVLARAQAGLAAAERLLDEYFGTDAYRKAA